MIDVIVDERTLGAGDLALDGLQLLRDIDARTMLLDHPDNAVQVAGSALETLDDGRMVGVVVMSHCPV